MSEFVSLSQYPEVKAEEVYREPEFQPEHVAWPTGARVGVKLGPEKLRAEGGADTKPQFIFRYVSPGIFRLTAEKEAGREVPEVERKAPPSVTAGEGELPPWLIPLGIAAGAGVLAFVIIRRRRRE